MLFFYPFTAILLSRVAVSAPASAPGPLPVADSPGLGHLIRGLGTFVKRLANVNPREDYGSYGSYGGYGKYGSYGNYPDLGGEVNNEASSEFDIELQPELTQTMTTTMPALTTTVTLRPAITPAATITAYCPMLDTTSSASDSAITCTRVNNSV